MRRLSALTILVPLLLALLGCGESDPRAAVLSERARWNVQLLSWAQTESGSINMTVRLSGPVRTGLKQLTVRVDLLGEDDAVVGQHWDSFDLTQVQRGGPEDVSLRVPPPEVAVGGIALHTVPDPTPEESVHIKELQGL